MRSRRLKTTIRLLDIKTLCEYFANTCTYVGGLEKSAHNGFHVVETYEQFSDIGKPFFDLLTRLSLTDMIAYFKHSTLESVDEFFIGISSSSFYSLLRTTAKIFVITNMQMKSGQMRPLAVCCLVYGMMLIIFMHL